MVRFSFDISGAKYGAGSSAIIGVGLFCILNVLILIYKIINHIVILRKLNFFYRIMMKILYLKQKINYVVSYKNKCMNKKNLNKFI